MELPFDADKFVDIIVQDGITIPCICIEDENLYIDAVEQGKLLDVIQPEKKISTEYGKQQYFANFVKRRYTIDNNSITVIEFHIPTNAHYVSYGMYEFNQTNPLQDKILNDKERLEYAKQLYKETQPDNEQRKTLLKSIIDDLVLKHLPTGDTPSSLKKSKQQNKSKPADYHDKDFWKNDKKARRNFTRLFGMYLDSLVTDSILYEKYEREHCSCSKTTRAIGRPAVPFKDGLFSIIDRVARGCTQEEYLNYSIEAKEKGFVEDSYAATTINNFLKSREITPYLALLLQISATPLAVVDSILAVDSSGFRTTQYENWLTEKQLKEAARKAKRSSKTKTAREEIAEHPDRYGCRINHWLKLHIICGTKTNIIVALRITDEYASDTSQFIPLVNEARKYFAVTDVTADKGYLSRLNYNIMDKLGIRLYVPFKNNMTYASVSHNDSTPFNPWIRAFNLYSRFPEKFNETYHKRSNVESTFSAIKERFGETLQSRTETGQLNELYCKAIVYNISVLIRQYYLNGMLPDFINEEKIKAIEI